MSLTDIYYLRYVSDQLTGALNYYWDIRSFLVDYDINSDLNRFNQIPYPGIKDEINYLLETKTYQSLFDCLILISIQSFKYVEYYPADGSLKKVIKICNNPKNIFNLKASSDQLDILANLFNVLNKSGRKNLHCYDCGTVARAVFYNLIKYYRRVFELSTKEVLDIRKEYLIRDYSTPLDSLNSFFNNVESYSPPSVFIVALQFGENKFGHLFVLEKLPSKLSNVNFRLYQSALGSYLLIDYVYSMQYLNPNPPSLDWDEFKNDLIALSIGTEWTNDQIKLFVKWFKFYPQSRITDASKFRVFAGGLEV